MSDSFPSVQQVLGEPSDVSALGKVWKFGPPNQKAKAVLEELFTAAAVEELVGREKKMPPAVYAKYSRMMLARIDAGSYATRGDGWLAMLTNPAYHPLFLLSLFRVNHPEMTVPTLLEIAEQAPLILQAALVRQVPGFFETVFPDMTPEMRAEQARIFREAVESTQATSPPSTGDSPPKPMAL